MILKDLAWVVVLLVTLSFSTVTSLYFHIAETERKCFIEEIPDDTTVIGLLRSFNKFKCCGIN